MTNDAHRLLFSTLGIDIHVDRPLNGLSNHHNHAIIGAMVL